MFEQEVFLWLPVEEEATLALESFLPAVSCHGLITREGRTRTPGLFCQQCGSMAQGKGWCRSGWHSSFPELRLAFVGEGNAIVTTKERPKAANSFGLLSSLFHSNPKICH